MIYISFLQVLNPDARFYQADLVIGYLF